MSAFGGSQEIGAYHIAFGGDDTALARTLADIKANSERVVGGITRDAGGLQRTVASIGQTLAATFGAVVHTLGLAVAGLGAVTAAVDADERAQRRLSRALEDVSGNLQGDLASFDDFAEKLQRATGIGENFARKLGAIGADMGGLAGPALEQAAGAAIGLAAKYEHLGVTAESAMRMISAAARGDFSGFKALGIDVSNLADGQARYVAVVRAGLSGLREAGEEAGTTSGAMKSLWASTQEATAAFGQMIGLSGSGGSLIGSLASWVDDLAESMRGLRESMASMFSLDLSQATGGMLDGMAALQVGFANVFDGAWTELQVLFTRVQESFFGFFNWFLSFVPTAWAEGLIEAWGNITTGIQNLWDGLTSWIAKRLVDLAGIVDTIAQALGLLGEGESFIFGQDADAVKRGIDDDTARNTAERNAENERLKAERSRRLAQGEGVFDTSGFAAQREALMRELGDRMLAREADAKRTGGSQQAAGAAAAALAEEIAKIVPPDSVGLNPNAHGRPMSIQTAIGDLSAPGMDTTQRIQSEQLASQRRMERGIATIAAAAQRRRFRV